MTHSQLLLALLLIPSAIGLLILVLRWATPVCHRLVILLHLTSVIFVPCLATSVLLRVLNEGSLDAFHFWINIDSLGAIFLALVAITSFLTGIYSISYINKTLENGKTGYRKQCTYYGFFNLFLAAIILVILSENTILMWVAIEATTAISALLVCLYRKQTSLEAAWKYIVICSVGVAFGLYGTILFFSSMSRWADSPEQAASWLQSVQLAPNMDPTLAIIAFVFVLIGFGTKAGLFPLHTWLPDAYGEAPAPVSALLSSALSNCAFLVIIRFYAIAIKAAGPHLPQTLLLVFGMLSIAVGALFILVQRNIKRLLAYSSIENMGIVALAFGIGGPSGIFAGLLHALCNSIAKASAFCVSGDIEIQYGTSDTHAVKGVMNAMPISGVFFGISVLALAGLPPFNVFISEFFVLYSVVDSGKIVLCIITMLLLATVFAGIVRMVTGILLGKTSPDISRSKSSLARLAPLALFIIIISWMGIRLPQPVIVLIENATEIILSDKTIVWNTPKMPWETNDNDASQSEYPQTKPVANTLP